MGVTDHPDGTHRARLHGVVTCTKAWNQWNLILAESSKTKVSQAPVQWRLSTDISVCTSKEPISEAMWEVLGESELKLKEVAIAAIKMAHASTQGVISCEWKRLTIWTNGAIVASTKLYVSTLSMRGQMCILVLASQWWWNTWEHCCKAGVAAWQHTRRERKGKERKRKERKREEKRGKETNTNCFGTTSRQWGLQCTYQRPTVNNHLIWIFSDVRKGGYTNVLVFLSLSLSFFCLLQLQYPKDNSWDTLFSASQSPPPSSSLINNNRAIPDIFQCWRYENLTLKSLHSTSPFGWQCTPTGPVNWPYTLMTMIMIVVVLPTGIHFHLLFCRPVVPELLFPTRSVLQQCVAVDDKRMLSSNTNMLAFTETNYEASW